MISGNRVLNRADDKSHQDVVSGHPDFTKAITNIPGMSHHKIFSAIMHFMSGRKPIRRPDKKSNALTKVLVQTFLTA